MAIFGERLKQLREEKGLNQQELGDKIGVSKDTVYRWEASKMQPKEDHVSFLAGFFKVNYLYLMRNDLPVEDGVIPGSNVARSGSGVLT